MHLRRQAHGAVICSARGRELCVWQDLAEGMKELRSLPKGSDSGGMAPVYGMGAKSPDRGLIGEFLVAYQDVLLSGV